MLEWVADQKLLAYSTARPLMPPPAHLGEQVVQDMDANAVMNLAEDAVVPVHSGQPTPQVAPLLHQKACCGEGLASSLWQEHSFCCC